VANSECLRGGDTAEGITSTAVPLSSAAVSQIKAAIFMGDPRFVAGLSYEVGTCKAGGVSNSFHDLYLRFADFLVSIVRCPSLWLFVPQCRQDQVVLRRC